MKKTWIYRVEQITGDGVWYSSNGSFNNLYGEVVKDIPMPVDNRDKKYRAGCFSLEILFNWVSKDDIAKLGDKAIVTKYYCNDYKEIANGEVLFNPANCRKIVLNVI